MVFEKIRDLIAEQLEIDPELIKPETDLMLDLNADSLDAVDVHVDGAGGGAVDVVGAEDVAFDPDVVVATGVAGADVDLGAADVGCSAGVAEAAAVDVVFYGAVEDVDLGVAGDVGEGAAAIDGAAHGDLRRGGGEACEDQGCHGGEPAAQGGSKTKGIFHWSIVLDIILGSKVVVAHGRWSLSQKRRGFS